MKKNILRLGFVFILGILLLGVTGCTNKDIYSDAELYVEFHGGEIIERYTCYFDFNNKKMTIQENTTFYPIQTKEEFENSKGNNTRESLNEYKLNDEQISKIEELIKKEINKNEQINTNTSNIAKLTVENKEYAVNDYNNSWKDVLMSIVNNK